MTECIANQTEANIILYYTLPPLDYKRKRTIVRYSRQIDRGQ